MEPPDVVRHWVNELVGVAAEGDLPSGPLEAWRVLGPALAAVHAATIPVETEPATQMVIPGLEVPQSEGTRGICNEG